MGWGSWPQTQGSDTGWEACPPSTGIRELCRSLGEAQSVKVFGPSLGAGETALQMLTQYLEGPFTPAVAETLNQRPAWPGLTAEPVLLGEGRGWSSQTTAHGVRQPCKDGSLAVYLDSNRLPLAGWQSGWGTTRALNSAERPE